MNKDEAVQKLCVALDVPDSKTAFTLAERLAGRVGFFKVGMELFTASGPDVVKRLVSSGAKVFLDLKFHDIPNTVAGVSRVVAPLRVSFFNVHASGGPEMMKAAVLAAKETSERLGVVRPKILAVTVLTSIDDETHKQITRTEIPVREQVQHLARMAQDAGIDGVVASPQEIEFIRGVCGKEFLIVTPGVRPAGGDLGDQKRVLTPAQAVKIGADILVVGRPITAANDPALAADQIIGQMQNS